MERTRIGTTIHDEEVTLAQTRGGYVVKIDGTTIGELTDRQSALDRAAEFVPTHRRTINDDEPVYEVILEATGDRVEAPDFDAALRAARQLVDDVVEAKPSHCKNRLRRTLYVVADGVYQGTLTALAREGAVA